MATVLHIGDTFSITENGRFNIETRVHLNGLGFPDSLETFIEIEGDVTQGGSLSGSTIDSTPSGVYDAIQSIQDQAESGNPAHFYVAVDGNTKFDYEPSTCINSPVVTSFRTIQDTGAGVNHWKYAMSVYIQQIAQTNTNGVLEFTSAIATTSIVTTNGPRAVRKHWTAMCRGIDVTTAYAFIVSLAPSAPTLTQTYARFFQEGRVTGDWVWDYNQNQKIEEEITVTGLGPSYVASTQVGADGGDVMPIIHRTPREAIVVLLEGTISSTDPSLVTLPELHWSEGDEFFHDLGNERVGERVIFDDLRGLYRLRYQERWIGTRYVPPNHHGHEQVPVLQEPSDGPIADRNR